MMRASNTLESAHMRSMLGAAATACYIAAVVILIHALALQVRLEPKVERVTRADPAQCADAAGLDRSICKADAKIDAARAKIKRHLAKRRLQDVMPSAEISALAEKPDLGLFLVGDTLNWNAETGAAARSRGAQDGSLARTAAPAAPTAVIRASLANR